jgi:hypothetical protein
MHFMIIILVFLLCVVVWGFFHANPTGVSGTKLAAANIVVLLGALAVGAIVGTALYGDAVSVKADEKGMATYLAIMAAGTSFLIVVATGGLIRNLVVFPRSRRAPPPSDAA